LEEAGRSITAREAWLTLASETGAIKAVVRLDEEETYVKQKADPISRLMRSRDDAEVRSVVRSDASVVERDCRYPMRTASAKL